MPEVRSSRSCILYMGWSVTPAMNFKVMEPKYLTLIQLAAIAFVLALVVVVNDAPEKQNGATAEVVTVE